MSAPSLYRSFLLAAGVAFLALTAAHAEDAQTISFSDPSKPGTLKIHIGHGDVVIHAADTNEIAVSSDAKAEGKPRKDGLRVIASRDSYVISEQNNVATLEYGLRSYGGHDSDFKIVVPRNTNIVVSANYGGDISVYDTAGDVEVRSMSGDVKLLNTRGGASVETMNGEITANVRELPEGKQISFISMNGEVHLKVPETAKANVQFSTHNGTILTDFDDSLLKTKTESVVVKGAHASTTKTLATADKSVKGDSEDDDEDSADWHKQVHDAMRDAGREIAEASREAARAAKQAAEEFRSSMDDSSQPVPPMPPLPPIPPSVGGKTVTGTINGGGPMIQVSTMNGDIVLRKAQAPAATPAPAPAPQK